MNLLHPSIPARLCNTIEVSGIRGCASGYSTALDSGLPANYLGEFIPDPAGLIQRLRLEFGTTRVALLKSMNVEEGERGQGHGNALLRGFLAEANGADVLLIADAHESQAEGFDLVQWYQGWGFRTVCETGAGPLMILTQ